MTTETESHTLEVLLEKLAEPKGDQEEVSVRDLRDTIGRRSFGPVLLVTA